MSNGDTETPRGSERIQRGSDHRSTFHPFLITINDLAYLNKHTVVFFCQLKRNRLLDKLTLCIQMLGQA